MTIIRDWAEEGATPEELALLSASRNERPEAASRARTLAALGVGTVVTAATSTSVAAVTTVGGTTLKLVGKIALAVVVAGGASGIAWQATRSEPAPHASAATPPSPRKVEPAVVVKPPVNEAPAVEEAPPESKATAQANSAPSRSVRQRTTASSDTLAQQVAALEKAHAALGAHDPDAALRALDRYRARFPDGELSSEEKMLRVKATLARGDKRRAAALADELRATDPDSPYARRVEDLVSRDKTDSH